MRPVDSAARPRAAILLDVVVDRRRESTIDRCPQSQRTPDSAKPRTKSPERRSVVLDALCLKLRPVTFYYKTDRNPDGRTLQYGLIAEEVAEVYPGLVARRSDGRIETVKYQFRTPLLLNEYQNQQRTIEAQSVEVRRQATRIAELESKHALQIARIEALERQALDTAALKQLVANVAQLQHQAAGMTQTAVRRGAE